MHKKLHQSSRIHICIFSKISSTLKYSFSTFYTYAFSQNWLSNTHLKQNPKPNHSKNLSFIQHLGKLKFQAKAQSFVYSFHACIQNLNQIRFSGFKPKLTSFMFEERVLRCIFILCMFGEGTQRCISSFYFSACSEKGPSVVSSVLLFSMFREGTQHCIFCFTFQHVWRWDPMLYLQFYFSACLEKGPSVVSSISTFQHVWRRDPALYLQFHF